LRQYFCRNTSHKVSKKSKAQRRIIKAITLAYRLPIVAFLTSEDRRTINLLQISMFIIRMFNIQGGCGDCGNISVEILHTKSQRSLRHKEDLKQIDTKLEKTQN
jgi:hypothetical protein